ncbi:MAG TPA: peptidoglycan-binding protein, partial [Acidimicrobiales bacterium]|nr:peptidoglycan-binding protein [Acidimicrobiales bacterium]
DQEALKGTEASNSQSLAQAEQAVSQDQAALKGTETSNSQSLAQAVQAVSQDQEALKGTETSNSQSLAQAEQQFDVATSTLSADQAQLTSDEARLSADEQKEAADCAAGGSAASTGSGGSTSACSTDEAQVAQDQSTVSSDKQKVTSDNDAVRADQASIVSTKTNDAKSLQQAQAQLAAAQATVAATQTNNVKSMQQAQAQLAAAQATVAATQTNNAKSVQEAGAQLEAAQATVAATKTNNQKSAQQAEAQLQAAQDSVSATQTDNAKSTQQAQAQLAAAQATVAATKTNNQKSAQQAEAQETAARMTLSQDESQLSEDQADAAVGTTGGAGSPTYTYLPQVGQVIGRGQELFAIDEQPSFLLYGTVTPWRAFMPGMSPGPDVAALNTNLDALGYGKGLQGDQFTASTGVAVVKFQAAHHVTPTGQLALGSVLFDPGQIEVNAVTPTIGAAPSAGQAVLQVTLTARQVQIALDASQESDVAVGDQVSIVMPDNSTTPGVVSYVGTVATTPSSQNGGSGSPTIEVNVTPTDPAATGNLDDLPVNVWITQASVPNAYVVPVDALTALAGGGYALEVAPPHGAHYLEAVTVGLFDDADGVVQVSGSGVHAGQRVVVPQV